MRSGRPRATKRFRFRSLLPGLLLAFATAAILFGPDRPPPRLLFRYGLPPAGGPTGRTVVLNRIEYAEIAPGYARVRRRVFAQKGDFLGSVCRPLGLPIGIPHRPSPEWRDGWVEAPRRFWIGRAARKEEDRGRLPGYVRGESVPSEPSDDLIYFADAFGVFPLPSRTFVHVGRSRGSPFLLLGPGWSRGDLTLRDLLDVLEEEVRRLSDENLRLEAGGPASLPPGPQLLPVFPVWVPPE